MPGAYCAIDMVLRLLNIYGRVLALPTGLLYVEHLWLDE
jgi:hypothetical protein